MNETDKQVLIGVGVLSLGLIVGLWSAGDTGDEMRKLVYRAELPSRCLQVLKGAEAPKLVETIDELFAFIPVR
jgi:hypothetical protein